MCVHVGLKIPHPCCEFPQFVSVSALFSMTTTSRKASTLLSSVTLGHPWHRSDATGPISEMASSQRNAPVATERSVSPSKPPNPRGLLSLAFPMPHPGKDHNPIVTEGRQHTGNWQRRHSCPWPEAPKGAMRLSMGDGAVYSKSFSHAPAQPNGYRHSVHRHGSSGTGAPIGT